MSRRNKLPRWSKLARSLLLGGAALVPVLVRPGLAHEETSTALREVERALLQQPRASELQLGRADLLRAARRWDEALAAVDAAARDGAHADAADLARSQVLLDAGRAAQAKGVLDGLLSRTPRHAKASWLRAQANLQLREERAAVADFDRAVEVDPRPAPDLYLARARTLAHLGDAERALGGLDEGVQRLGPLAALQLEAVQVESQRGHYDAALVRLDKLLQRVPCNVSWLERKASLLKQLERGTQADATLAFAAACPRRRSGQTQAQRTRALTRGDE